METYNSEFAVEAETSDGEQAPLFRSGVGILHCDGLNKYPICSENIILIHVSHKHESFGCIETFDLLLRRNA